MQKIRELIAPEFEQVNNRVIENLASRVDLVENIGHYLVEAGGKRLRPILALLAAKACHFKGQAHIDFAVVIEFIHTATLLHDDVVDISMLRRGRPTVNANWGNAPSVLVGDFIYSRAFQMLVNLDNMAVMRLLSDTTNQIAEGEVLQLVKAGDPSCSMSDYFKVINDKTAILFAAAMKGSAILSGCNDTIQTALYNYGLKLGIAFQLADDVLDYRGNASTMGKNIGDDLSEGKATLPLIYSIQNGSDDDKTLITNAIAKKTSENLPKILDIIQSNGAFDFTLEHAQRYVNEAKEQLYVLEESPFKTALAYIADFSISRTS